MRSFGHLNSESTIVLPHFGETLYVQINEQTKVVILQVCLL